MKKITEFLATIGIDNEVTGFKIPEGWRLFDIRDLLYDEPKNQLGDYNLCITHASDLIRNGEKVIIGCSAGISRSNAIAIGVLMRVTGMSYDQAYDLVHEMVTQANIEPCHLSALRKISKGCYDDRSI